MHARRARVAIPMSVNSVGIVTSCCGTAGVIPLLATSWGTTGETPAVIPLTSFPVWFALNSKWTTGVIPLLPLPENFEKCEKFEEFAFNSGVSAAATPVLLHELVNRTSEWLPCAAAPVSPRLANCRVGVASCRSIRGSATPVLLHELVNQVVRRSAGRRRGDTAPIAPRRASIPKSFTVNLWLGNTNHEAPLPSRNEHGTMLLSGERER